ncbi:MAG: hypothetical protein ACOX2F_03115 [bacterium]
MKEEQIEKLIANGESENVEFKKGGQKVGKEVVERNATKDATKDATINGTINITDKTPISTDKKFMTNEMIVINYLQDNDFITNNIARTITGLSADGVKSLFRRLIKANHIKK